MLYQNLEPQYQKNFITKCFPLKITRLAEHCHTLNFAKLSQNDDDLTKNEDDLTQKMKTTSPKNKDNMTKKEDNLTQKMKTTWPKNEDNMTQILRHKSRYIVLLLLYDTFQAKKCRMAEDAVSIFVSVWYISKSKNPYVSHIKKKIGWVLPHLEFIFDS